MPTALRFYKTKFNRGNRAYDGTALDNILGAAPSSYFAINPTIIPDVDFYFMPGSASTTDVLLGGYDYISYQYNGRIWYSFIDDIQPIASDEGKFRVSHTTDKWAMAIKYFMGTDGTFHMNGSVERAHVNDLVLETTGSYNAYPDMSNTLATTEAPYNTALIKKNRQGFYNATTANLKYLYVYFANPREVLSNPAEANQEFRLGSYENRLGSEFRVPVEGLLCVYLISPSGYCYYRNSNTEVTGGGFYLNTLTSSAITAMFISTIPPCSYEANFSGVEFILSPGVGGVPYTWDRNAPNAGQLNTIQPTTSTGLPPYLNFFTNVYGIGFIPDNCIDTSMLSNGVISRTTAFNSYLQSIPKMLTTIYSPMVVNGYRYPPQVGQAPSFYLPQYTIKISVSSDLEHILVGLPENNRYTENLSAIVIKDNNCVFASNAVVDYWTRLNAKQSTISANQQQYNAIVKPIASAVSNIGSIASGKIASGVSGLVSTALSAGNSVYAYQSAENLKEMAAQQYNAGETRAGQSTGRVSCAYDNNEACIETFSCELQYDIIAPNLHRYGYNTFLPIDEIYANHQRKFFNYFKGIDVSVSGMPIAWCNDIADMFNSGVTLWQSDVENYERCNYQANLNW